jgi:hypothetical protein
MLGVSQGRAPHTGGLRSSDEHRESNMLKHSTVESVEARQPTLLACVETLLAIAIYGFIAWRYQTYVHFVVAAVFAPLFLLRTRESTDWLFSNCKNLIDSWNVSPPELPKNIEGLQFKKGNAISFFSANLLVLLVLPVYFFFHAFIGFIVIWARVILYRVFSNFYWLIRRPAAAFGAIPQNWFQQAFCVDTFFLPELIPGENLLAKQNQAVPVIVSMYFFIKTKRRGLDRVLAMVLSAPILVSYGLSLFYRIGFKATSIFYFPLVWVSSRGLNDGRPVYERLSRFGAGELEKARRALSLVIAPIVVLKAAVMLGFIDLKAAMDNLIESAWLEKFLSPGFWSWWIVAVTIEIVLTFVLFFFADEAIARKEGAKPWSAQRVESVAAALITLRSAVAVVLVCSGVVFAVSAFLKTM